MPGEPFSKGGFENLSFGFVVGKKNCQDPRRGAIKAIFEFAPDKSRKARFD